MSSEIQMVAAMSGAGMEVLPSAKGGRRGWSVCGIMSVMVAGMVLVMPWLAQYYYWMGPSILEPRGLWDSPTTNHNVMLTIVPAVIMVCLPVSGLSFAACSLASGLKAQAMLMGGMLVNAAGLLAGILILTGTV